MRDCRLQVAETEGKLARQAAERLAIEQEFSAQQALAAPDLSALAAFRHKTLLDRQALQLELQTRQISLDAQRQKLLAERRRLEVIEKLRERALDEYRRASDREVEVLSHESYLSTWVSRPR
ncbi:MAG TPA: flagellar FliJ family protein [Bryobacteraceae bacterium]|nr:flagellar FliJ family protein [Bryobacteraceae bacterium]